MKRSSAMALIISALSLLSLTCQKSAQPSGGGSVGNSNNSPANAQANSAAQQPSAPQTQLKVGDRAPDFELTDTEGQKVRLSDFRGKKNVVLAFYVLAFTGG
jgi:cytochrome oxidase Cu insertion factor (SCO1/SenC/PrrC family)